MARSSASVRPRLCLACLVMGSATLFGCSGVMSKDDGRALGDDMGRFHVKARLDESTCGPQAMDTPENWEFDVVLSQEAPTIYWNTGPDAVEGQLAADGRAFTFQSEVVVNVDERGAATAEAKPGACAIVRTDGASGTLDSAKSAKAFDGELRYSFAPQGSSDCGALLAAGNFAALPCAMTYQMAAAWVSDR